MIVFHAFFFVALILVVGYAFGWFIVAPIVFGYRPFTSPERANEIERERRRR